MAAHAQRAGVVVGRPGRRLLTMVDRTGAGPSSSSSAAAFSTGTSIRGDDATALLLPCATATPPGGSARRAILSPAPYRSFASSSVSEGSHAEGDTDDVRYHREADRALDIMFEEFERMVDDAGMEDADIELSQGVLTLKLGALGTYVINKQAPNRQIWVSSPVSGPMRYDLVKGFWVNSRGEGSFLHEVLQNEMRKHVGFDVDLSPCSHCLRENACLDTYECTK